MVDDLYRYRQAYYFYYRSIERFLPEMSIAVRWSKSAMFALKHRYKYTPADQRIAQKYREVSPFIEVDFFNVLLHARILLDRIAALSRSFLPRGEVPWRSFADHKKWLSRHGPRLKEHSEYVDRVVHHTPWFDAPLKVVRDEYLVHAGPEHMRWFGFNEHELSMTILPGGAKGPPFEILHVSVPRLYEDMGEFLSWFSAYASPRVHSPSLVQGDEKAP